MNANLAPWRMAALMVTAIGVAIGAQWLLAAQNHALAIGAYAVALTLWLVALRNNPTAAITTAAPAVASISLPLNWTQAVLVALALILAALTFVNARGNTFTIYNITPWLASIVVFLIAFWELGAGGWRVRVAAARAWVVNLARAGMYLRWRALVLPAVILLGAFFYYYRLDQLPGEMTSDHAEKLFDVYDVLNGQYSIFFTRNTGREPLQFYLTAAFMTLTGHPLDFMALKLVTATVGLLVVPLTFLIGREMFDDATGWLAAAFVGINLWGVGIARMGLRFPFTLFFAALTWLFLWRALKYRRRNDYLLTGLALGVGLYGYHAFKIMPLVVAACGALWFLFNTTTLARARAALPRFVVNAALVVALALIVFVPLLRYMFDHPGEFWYRVMTRVAEQETSVAGSPLLIFADNLKNVLLMFNVQGDQSWPNTLSDVSVLDEVSGGLFVLGAALALYRLAARREAMYAYLLAALLLLLLPSALALAFPIENPSVVRAGGAIPFVFLLVALPLARAGRMLRSAWGGAGVALAAALITAVLGVSALLNYDRYFVRFEEQYRRYAWNSSEVAAVIRAFAQSVGTLDHAWVVAYPHWVDTRNVAINLGRIAWSNVVWDVRDAPDAANDPHARLFVLSPLDDENLEGLRLLYPQGQARVYHARTLGKEFVVFYVPGTMMQDFSLDLRQ